MDNKFTEFLEANNLRQIDLVNYLHCSRTQVCKLAGNKAEISDSMLRQILSNPHGWDVSMLPEPKKQQVAASSRYAPLDVILQPRETKDDSIPVIPIEAHAGALSDYSDPSMDYQCERIVSPIAGATCAIRIAGDSMAPEYPNGSIVVLKKVNEKAFVEWGKVYVLDTCNGSVIKQVRKTDRDNMIECVSLNPDYQPFTIDTEYINGWYRVLLVMTLK